jgi:DnaK suppressor protein
MAKASAKKKPAKPAAKKAVKKPAPAKKAAPKAAKKPAPKPVAKKAAPAPKAAAKKAPPAKPAKAEKKITPKMATPSKPIVKAKPRSNYKPAKLPQGYKPVEKEEYMNALQLEYFRQKLLKWRSELLSESRETLEHLHEENWHQADIADRASLETEAGVELRTRNRYLKLISKIDAAITRIETGEYGYCEESGEPIGLKRLEARPVATLSIEAQERHEKMERQYTDEE